MLLSNKCSISPRICGRRQRDDNVLDPTQPGVSFAMNRHAPGGNTGPAHLPIAMPELPQDLPDMLPDMPPDLFWPWPHGDIPEF